MSELIIPPFAMTDTDEPYQPIRLTFQIHNVTKFLKTLARLHCMQFDADGNRWFWQRKNESRQLKFLHESDIGNFTLGTLSIYKAILRGDFPSFERAYTTLPLLYQWFDKRVFTLLQADFCNYFVAVDDPKDCNYSALFVEQDLIDAIESKKSRLKILNEMLESAQDNEKRSQLLIEYAQKENQLPLPVKERYLFPVFHTRNERNNELLAFMNALNLRLQVALQHWLGNNSFTLYHVLANPMLAKWQAALAIL